MLQNRRLLYERICSIKFESKAELVSWAFDSGKVITFTNPVNFLDLANRGDLTVKIDHIFCDGIVAAKWFSFFLGIQLKRYSFDFTSLAAPY